MAHNSPIKELSPPLNDLLENMKPEDRKRLVSEMIYDAAGRKLYDPIVTNKTAFVQSRFKRPTLNPVHPSVEKWFKSMETKTDGIISAKELQTAYEVFQGRHFSEGACKFIVKLFNLEKTGGVDLKEFETLYTTLKQWTNAFNTYDRESSGYLDETELDSALKTLDINFTPDFIRFLITKNNPKARKMPLDQFILTCIQIQKFTQEFKTRDKGYSGKINIKYEDFLEMIMRCL